MDHTSEQIVKHIVTLLLSIGSLFFVSRNVSAMYDRKSDIEGSAKVDETESGKHKMEASIKINDK